MAARPELSTTWDRALGWRLERQLLDPVGSQDVAGVVRRLGAVLSMDESLAELAVRARQSAPDPGGLAAALEAGEVVKAFAFRGAVHYLSPEDGGCYLALRCAGRQWELPSWVEFYRLAPEDWPDFRAAVREALADGPLTVAELGEALTRRPAYRHLGPVFDEGAGTLVKPLTWQGDMGFGPPRDGQAHVPAPRHQPAVAGRPRARGRRPARDHGVPPQLRPRHPEHVHHWLGAGLSAGRKRLDRWLDRAGGPAGRGRRRGHHGVRRGAGRRGARGGASRRRRSGCCRATTSG